MAFTVREENAFTPANKQVAFVNNGLDMLTNKVGAVGNPILDSANEASNNKTSDGNLFSTNNNSEEAKRKRTSGNYNVKSSAETGNYSNNNRNAQQQLIQQQVNEINQQIWEIDEKSMKDICMYLGGNREGSRALDTSAGVRSAVDGHVRRNYLEEGRDHVIVEVLVWGGPVSTPYGKFSRRVAGGGATRGRPHAAFHSDNWSRCGKPQHHGVYVF